MYSTLNFPFSVTYHPLLLHLASHTQKSEELFKLDTKLTPKHLNVLAFIP